MGYWHFQHHVCLLLVECSSCLWGELEHWAKRLWMQEKGKDLVPVLSLKRTGIIEVHDWQEFHTRVFGLKMTLVQVRGVQACPYVSLRF